MTNEVSTLPNYIFDKLTGWRLNLPTHIEPGSRVLALYRVSTDKQLYHTEENDADIPMQRIRCREFCERMGWTLVCELQEEGVSGHKVRAEQRDKIQLIKEYTKEKKFDILLVFMFDRLGRIENETPFVLEWFVKSGIAVWSAKEGQQTFENDTDYLMNYIRFWQAGGESRKTSIRVKTRLGQLVEEGRFTGGVCPFGYRFIKSGVFNKKGKELVTLEINPEEAAIVRFIFDKTVREGYGTWRLSSAINKLGYKTHNGAKFQANTVNRILNNSIYTGRFVRGGKSSEVIDEIKIIDDYAYEEAYKILKERSKKREERNSIAFTTKGKALLSGNIYCAHCGARLYTTTYSNPVTLSDGTVKRYTGLKYMCTNKARGRGRCEGQGQYIVERIDAIVLETINDLLNKIHDNIKDVTIKRNYERVLKEKRDLYAGLMKEYSKEQDKLKKLVEEVGKALINESVFSVDIINQSINQSKTRLAELEEKIPKALKELNDQDGMLKNLDQYYDQFIGWADSFASASLEEKKMIICRLISRIEIGRDYNVNIVLNVNYSQFVE